MVNQVQVVSILMIVNGSLVSLMGLYLTVMGPVMYFLMQSSPTPPPTPGMPGWFPTFMVVLPVVYVVLGLASLTTAVLNIVAGIRCLRFRGRTFALVALLSNILPVFTCYCLPTCIGMMVYGLIVFFQADVAYAFAAVKAGAPPERFKRRRRYDEDDFEEDEVILPREPERPSSQHVRRDPNEPIRRPPPEE